MKFILKSSWSLVLAAGFFSSVAFAQQNIVAGLGSPGDVGSRPGSVGPAESVRGSPEKDIAERDKTPEEIDQQAQEQQYEMAGQAGEDATEGWQEPRPAAEDEFHGALLPMNTTVASLSRTTE